MQKNNFQVALFGGVVGGALVEWAIGAIAHRREAWDWEGYWLVVPPLLCLIAFGGGAIARQRTALIGYAPFIGAWAAMMVKSGVGPLWPLGLGVMLVMGIAGVFFAWLGKKLRG